MAVDTKMCYSRFYVLLSFKFICACIERYTYSLSTSLQYWKFRSFYSSFDSTLYSSYFSNPAVISIVFRSFSRDRWVFDFVCFFLTLVNVRLFSHHWKLFLSCWLKNYHHSIDKVLFSLSALLSCNHYCRSYHYSKSNYSVIVIEMLFSDIFILPNNASIESRSETNLYISSPS